MSYYDSDDPRITIRRRRGTFDIGERVTRDRYRSNRYEDYDNESSLERPKEYSRSTSRLLRGRVPNIPSQYSSPSRSRGRFIGRSPSPLRNRSYYEESPPPALDYVPGSRRHEQYPHSEFAPPVDKDGNPLTLYINLISSAKDERGPGWTSRRPEFASQLPESLSLEASRAFIDESETEKILLTPDSMTDLTKAAKLRWM
jgi:hypothetical protein